MQPTYMTTDELVSYLANRYPRAYNKRTINNWRYLGRGPAWFKQAGRVLYKLDDVQAWEAAGGVMQQGGKA